VGKELFRSLGFTPAEFSLVSWMTGTGTDLAIACQSN
jgi:hypothetical protein